MKILITGGSGLVGSSLSKVLLGMNYDVAILTRNPSSDIDVKQYFWDPSKLLIDEDALINALNNGKVAAAALDVFVGEPSPRTDVISHNKISLTPHIGAATVEAQERIGTELADKIISFYNK